MPRALDPALRIAPIDRAAGDVSLGWHAARDASAYTGRPAPFKLFDLTVGLHY